MVVGLVFRQSSNLLTPVGQFLHLPEYLLVLVADGSVDYADLHYPHSQGDR
jgi:hypothetical protein